MSSVPVIPNFNGTTPPAPTGQQLALWQVDALNPADISTYVRNTGGVDARTTTSEIITLVDQGKLVTINNNVAVNVVINVTALPNTFCCFVENLGAGTAKVNATAGNINGVATVNLATGQSAGIFYDGANFFAALGGGSSSGGLVIGFVINNGAIGNDIGPMLQPPRAGTVSKCAIVTKASDSLTNLVFRIMQNGVSVFTVSPTVTAGTASGTTSSSTSLTSVPLPVSVSDVFSIDILGGSPNWAFTAQLET
jgi:hypothetical protein